MMFNDVFVKLIEGPLFIDLALNWESKAGMSFDELKAYLVKQEFDKTSIDSIWDQICQFNILVLLSIQHSFDVYKVEDKTY